MIQTSPASGDGQQLGGTVAISAFLVWDIEQMYEREMIMVQLARYDLVRKRGEKDDG